MIHSDEARKAKESAFHDEYVSSPQVRAAEATFYSQAARNLEEHLVFEFLGPLEGREVLLYGSGGHFSFVRALRARGARVCAIDISPKTIELLNAAIEREGLAETCRGEVMDCEKLGFSDETWDVVVGRSIVHHLETATAVREIHRVLRPGGKACVLEPLGTNPLINLYRRATPNARTPDEHPLTPRDLRLFGRAFPEVSCRYLYFTSLVAYLYRAAARDEASFERIFASLNRLDQVLLKVLPPLRHLCWDVLIRARKG